MQKVTDILTRDEIKDLVTASDWRGWVEILVSWSMIAACFVLVGYYPHWLTAIVAIIILGGRQLGLSILMHEASHRSLFRSKRLNEVVGKWLCAAPVWTHLDRYRIHHMAHHIHTQTEKDTDVGLTEPFPTSRVSLLRKALRDLTGITGFKRVIGLVLMDLGFLSYTASTGAKKIDQEHRTRSEVVRMGMTHLGPIVLTNFILWGVLFVMGYGWLYLLWVVAYFTTFSLFVRIRSIAEHACTSKSTDPFLNTRTTYANWFARLTVAPHYVNYHLEHHLLMTVPCYRLKQFHHLLQEREALTQSHVETGYWKVLNRASQTLPL